MLPVVLPVNGVGISSKRYCPIVLSVLTFSVGLNNIFSQRTVSVALVDRWSHSSILITIEKNLDDQLRKRGFLIHGRFLECGEMRNFAHRPYSQRPQVHKDHLLITTTFTSPHNYTFHVTEPVYIDHLCIRTIFCWFLGWSLYTSFTIFVKAHNLLNSCSIYIQCSLNFKTTRSAGKMWS